jgi:far upstream element-binding protein
MCTLTGTPDAIVAARAQINAVIANEGQRMGGGGGQRNGGGGMGGGGGGMGGGSFEMMIEGPLVARVIGKGGENIKRLQEETGAKIVIIQVEAKVYLKILDQCQVHRLSARKKAVLFWIRIWDLVPL